MVKSIESPKPEVKSKLSEVAIKPKKEISKMIPVESPKPVV